MSDPGWFGSPNWKDYADKSWLRPTRGMLRRGVALLWDMMIVLLILVAIVSLIRPSDTQAQAMKLVLLEPSAQAATLDECQRTHPARGRPQQVVSFQNGSMTNWHHRTCYYA